MGGWGSFDQLHASFASSESPCYKPIPKRPAPHRSSPGRPSPATLRPSAQSLWWHGDTPLSQYLTPPGASTCQKRQNQSKRLKWSSADGAAMRKDVAVQGCEALNRRAIRTAWTEPCAPFGSSNCVRFPRLLPCFHLVGQFSLVKLHSHGL